MRVPMEILLIATCKLSEYSWNSTLVVSCLNSQFISAAAGVNVLNSRVYFAALLLSWVTDSCSDLLTVR